MSSTEAVPERIIAITKVLGIAILAAHDHPQDHDVWMGAGISALLELGVTDAEMAAAFRHAPFIELDPAKEALIDLLVATAAAEATAKESV